MDSAGQAYITGTTDSPDFPAARGPGYDTSYNGGWDAFVVKLNAAGRSLAYATFLGGSEEDMATASPWTTPGRPMSQARPSQPTSRPPSAPATTPATTATTGDAFVVKLDATGTALLYATFLGGSSLGRVAWHRRGQRRAGLCHGRHRVNGLPGQPRPRLRHGFNGGTYDAFVVKLDAAGTSLRYATFLGGGAMIDQGGGIAVDGAGQAYVTGETCSNDFPATLGPASTPPTTAATDAFVVKLDAAGTALLYATFLGGSGETWARGIAVDSAGQAYVTGVTDSRNFPAASAPATTPASMAADDAFVVKLNAAGTGAALCHLPRRSATTTTVARHRPGRRRARPTSRARPVQPNFPASLGPGYDTTYNGGTYDAFVVKLDAAGTGLLYATFLGGSGDDVGDGIAVDSAGQAYVAGYTTQPTSRPASAPATIPPSTAASRRLCRQAGHEPVNDRRRSPRAGARPTIDGNLTEWQALSQTLLDKDTASTITGEVPSYADLSAGLRAAWAPDALYFAAGITDDVLVGNNSTQIWGDDVIELGIRVPAAPDPPVHPRP